MFREDVSISSPSFDHICGGTRQYGHYDNPFALNRDFARGMSSLPFGDIFSSLQEASMIALLQRLFSLRDEGCWTLNALFAVCNLLSQFSQPHHLEWKHKKAVIYLRSQIMITFALLRQSWNAKRELRWMASLTTASFAPAWWWAPSSCVEFLIWGQA